MKRWVPSVVVFLAVVLVVGAIAGVMVVATEGAEALRVADQTVSRADLNDELRAVAENQVLLQQAGADRVTRSDGSVRADAGAALVTDVVIQDAVARRLLARKGESVTAADRAAAEELWPNTQTGQFAKGFPQWFQDRFIERLARFEALARVLGTDLTSTEGQQATSEALRRAARTMDVSVDPRYGRYVPKYVAVIPFGQTVAEAVGQNQSG